MIIVKFELKKISLLVYIEKIDQLECIITNLC